MHSVGCFHHTLSLLTNMNLIPKQIRNQQKSSTMRSVLSKWRHAYTTGVCFFCPLSNTMAVYLEQYDEPKPWPFITNRYVTKHTMPFPQYNMISIPTLTLIAPKKSYLNIKGCQSITFILIAPSLFTKRQPRLTNISNFIHSA